MSTLIVESWDPRMWAASWSPSADRGGPAGNASIGRWRARPIGIAAGVAILLIGAAIAWFSRPAPGEAPAAPSIASATPAEPQPSRIRRTIILSGASELETAMATSGIAADVARQIALASAPMLQPSGEIRAVLTLVQAPGGLELERLEASNSDSSGIVVSRAVSGEISVSQVAAQLSTRVLVKHGTMDGDSFYSSAVAIGVPNSLIPIFAKALAFDFNFQTEVAAGDAFEVAYAQPINAAGETAGAPTLLYASLTTASKAAAVYRFTPAGEEEGWFDSSGRSIVRALMRTPVDGARVTSKFGMRFHPILKFAKLHGGIDFAAPTGTPIYAAGTGVIEFAGPRGANGNFIALRHDNGWRTLYLHLHRFSPGVASGIRVTQGQQIGEVGTTGRSTGPHLHYEVHIDGEKVDPLGIETEAGQILEGQQLIAFEKVRDRIDVSRAAQAS